MMKDLPANCWLSLALFLPLGVPGAWHEVRFKNIAPNQIQFASGSVTFCVKDSSSALVLSLTNSVWVTRLRFEGRVRGNWPHAAQCPPGGHDDMILRVGLVESGSRHMNLMEKPFAPEWLRRLFGLLPEGAGVAEVNFFDVAATLPAKGSAAANTQKEGLVVEQVVATPNAEGQFNYTCALPKPLRVIAIWLSADGDDSHSSFTVTIERAKLATMTK